MSRRSILKSGTIYGKLPGMKDWMMYDLEVTQTDLHIYEGGNDTRKHLRSLELGGSDIVGEGKTSVKKRDYQLFIKRADGKYLFTCETPEERLDWITELQGVAMGESSSPIGGLGSPVQDVFNEDTPTYPRTPPSRKAPRPALPKRGKTFSESDKRISARDQPLPPIPVDSGSSGSSGDFNPRTSVFSVDSGIGPSTDGEVRRLGTSSVPSSGDGSFRRSSDRVGIALQGRGKSLSDGGKFEVKPILTEDNDPDELENYKWYWGHMNREECTRRLQSEGKVGNFVVRINAHGSYVLSLWRHTGVHHHKIIQHGEKFRFEKTAVQAEGYSLVDLLDTYMKNSVDKTIGPFGGKLYLVYHEPWNPPDVDMDVLAKRLRARKEAAARAEAAKAEQKKVKAAGQATRPKDRYEWLDLDNPSSPSPSSPPVGPRHEIAPAEKPKRKPLPPTPVKKPVRGDPQPLSSTIMDRREPQVPPSPPSREPVSPASPEGGKGVSKPLPNVPVSTRGKAPQHAMAAAMQERRNNKHTDQPLSYDDVVISNKGLSRTKSPPPPVAKKPMPPANKPTRSEVATSKPQPKPKMKPPPPTSPPPAQDETPVYANVHMSPHTTASTTTKGETRPYENHSHGLRSPPPYSNVDFPGGGQPTRYGQEAAAPKRKGSSHMEVNGTHDSSAGVYQNVTHTRVPAQHARRKPSHPKH